MPAKLTELGETAMATLVHNATAEIMAWKLEAGEVLLAKALVERRTHEHAHTGGRLPEPPRSPCFHTCVLAIA